MLQITKDNFKTEVEQHDGLVVIDLYADWCGPCKMLAPTIEQLASEMPDVKFAKVNVDNEPELARAFNVSSIPMIALVKPAADASQNSVIIGCFTRIAAFFG